MQALELPPIPEGPEGRIEASLERAKAVAEVLAWADERRRAKRG